MRSFWSEATYAETPPSAVLCFVELNIVVLLPIPCKKLLSLTRLRSPGIMFKYSSSVTMVESTLIEESTSYDRLLTATGELPALRRAFERSLLSCTMSSFVREASIF